MIRMNIYKLYITRARILLQIHVSFLKSKTHALWYIGVSDDADSESGVFILHVLHISVISAGTSIFFSLFSDFSCIFSYFRFSRNGVSKSYQRLKAKETMRLLLLQRPVRKKILRSLNLCRYGANHLAFLSIIGLRRKTCLNMFFVLFCFQSVL